jgi:predicted kinase
MTTKTQPYLIMIYGAPGSGKTYFAEQFSEKFRAPFLNFNDTRRQIFQKPTYSPDEDTQMQALSEQILSGVLKSGVMTVVEGGLSTKSDRRKIVKLANSAGYQPLLVWIQTDIKTTKSRAKANTPAGKIDAIIDALESPTASENPLVISGKHTFDTQVRVILRQLSAQHSNKTEE